MGWRKGGLSILAWYTGLITIESRWKQERTGEMSSKRIAVALLLGVIISVFAVTTVTAGTGCSKKCASACGAAEKKAESPEATVIKAQTICPVMGNEINKNLYADVDGKRVYVCCQGCIAAVKADPEKYLALIAARGETVAETPPILCGKCGQLKGTEECCMKDAVRCKDCGMAKGSPGCCIMPEAGKDVDLCTKCGEIKGSDDCCGKDMQHCKKCGLAKDSPGCCNI
ncbi:MAG: hypothetical protein ABIJ00_04645 [Candidatus Eisenbacteria bacterium]